MTSEGRPGCLSLQAGTEGAATSEDCSRNSLWRSSSLLFPYPPTFGLVVFKALFFFFLNEYLVVFPLFDWATFPCAMEQPWRGG